MVPELPAFLQGFCILVFEAIVCMCGLIIASEDTDLLMQNFELGFDDDDDDDESRLLICWLAPQGKRKEQSEEGGGGGWWGY